MAPGSNCLKIVRYYTSINDPTGTTRYQTEDGRHWRTRDWGYDSNATSQGEVRYLHGDRLCPHP